jgi:hypothetical protein
MQSDVQNIVQNVCEFVYISFDIQFHGLIAYNTKFVYFHVCKYCFLLFQFASLENKLAIHMMFYEMLLTSTFICLIMSKNSNLYKNTIIQKHDLVCMCNVYAHVANLFVHGLIHQIYWPCLQRQGYYVQIHYRV